MKVLNPYSALGQGGNLLDAQGLMPGFIHLLSKLGANEIGQSILNTGVGHKAIVGRCLILFTMFTDHGSPRIFDTIRNAESNPLPRQITEVLKKPHPVDLQRPSSR
jgi:hypothetical protein